MVNSDWLGGSGYDNGNANANNWTDRANSNVEIAQANNFDANLSYNVFYNINFNLGYKRTYFKWRDFGRDYIYSESSFRDTSGNFGGATGIIYDQTMNIPYIGLEVQQPLFKNKLLLTLSGAYSDQVSATGYDQHLVRNLDFRDEFEGGEYYNIGAKFDYFATKNLAIGFAYEYNEVKEIIGNSVTTNTTSGASTSCSDCAGLSNKYEKFSLSMKYLFDIPESVTSLFIQ
jgi:outer membrane protease